MFEKVKKFVDTKRSQVSNDKKKHEKNNKLLSWQEKFDEAWKNADIELYDEWESIYLGTRVVDANPNSTSSRATKEASNVTGIVYELIESQVNTNIPRPEVISKRKGFQDIAKVITEKITSDLEDSNIVEINDANERNTPVHGISGILVEWNNDITTYDYIGDKELVRLHAKQIIGQSGVYDIRRMDYIFIVLSMTNQEVYQRYGVEINDSEELPELRTLEGGRNHTDTGTNNDLVTVKVAYYKDDDGDIGKFTFCNDEVLEDIPKYYYPRIKVCLNCGEELPIETEQCPKCESVNLKEDAMMYETILEDMVLSPVTYTEKQKVIEKDLSGKVTVKETDKEVVVERVIPKNTVIPIYAPKIFPIALRINTPDNYHLRGMSDVEVIRDQQNTHKKLMSKAEEKITGAGTIIGIPEDLELPITNETYQVVRGGVDKITQITAKDLKADTTQDLAMAQVVYQQAKDTLGITDSFQGKYDPSAKSGSAKEIQIQQAAGRLSSKLQNKYNSFAKLFEIMFYFDLAFTNEKRPYTTENEQGIIDYGEFDKYELLIQSATGEWHYNTDFIFRSKNNDEIPTDKNFIYEQLTQMMLKGMFTKEEFFAELEVLGFPGASKILAKIRQEQGDKDTEFELLEVLKNLPPEQALAFIQLDKEQQMQFIQEMEGEANGMS